MTKNEGIIERFEEIGSTNDYAKAKRAEGRELLVIAKRQTGGRGTKGRSFVSDEGGIYLSKLSFYEDFLAEHAFKIMQNAAAAVCETLAFFGLKPKIKWPNDIFVNGRKICGILIENTFSGRFVASSVVGIGLNVNGALAPEIADIATTMQKEAGKSFPILEVERVLIENLERGVAEKYGAYIGWLGEEITLVLADKRIPARLLSVDEQGNLLAEIEGKKQSFAAAEISVRV